jgi:hypothetical protein
MVTALRSNDDVITTALSSGSLNDVPCQDQVVESKILAVQSEVLDKKRDTGGMAAFIRWRYHYALLRFILQELGWPPRKIALNIRKHGHSVLDCDYHSVLDLTIIA